MLVIKTLRIHNFEVIKSFLVRIFLLSNMLHTKLFVRERGEGIDYENKHGNRLPGCLNGDDVKQFYEEIISTKPEEKPIPKPKKPPRKREKPTLIPLNPKDIFTHSQNNDTTKLLQLLNSGVDVNARDTFGWTSLMCAACNGAEDAVKLLLKFGADVSAKDPGYDAKYLAKKHKHFGIVHLLRGRKSPSRATTSSQSKQELMNCDTCKQTYTSSRRRHEASTVHLLAKHAMKTKTFYGISETNRGFQMLMRNGWDREHGLGPDGSGRKFPVKAVEKKDRKGIGAPKVKVRNDAGVVLSRPKDRWFERNFRLQFR